MIALALRHLVAESALDALFSRVSDNFIKPQVLEKLRFKLVSVDFTSASRKLMTDYAFMAIHDIKRTHGIDIENELLQMLSREIEEEIRLTHAKDVPFDDWDAVLSSGKPIPTQRW